MLSSRQKIIFVLENAKNCTRSVHKTAVFGNVQKIRNNGTFLQNFQRH